MLYTASFWTPTDKSRYSIALSQPKGMGLPQLKFLAPPSQTFRDLKSGAITWLDYRIQYCFMLDQSERDILTNLTWVVDEAVLCCWEKDPAKCHRSLLAEWLNEHGIPTEELQ